MQFCLADEDINSPPACKINIIDSAIRSTSQGTFLPLGFSPRLYPVMGTKNKFYLLSFVFCFFF